jgi:y4mF family transcriptional regulator
MVKTNTPTRGLSSRLKKAVADARAVTTTFKPVVAAPRLSGLIGESLAGDVKIEIRKGTVLRSPPRAGPTKSPAKAKTKKRVIKTSTSADALRRHVAETVVGVDLQTPRGLIQIKNRAPVGSHDLSRLVERSPSVSTTVRPGHGLGGFSIEDAADLGRVIRLTRDQRDMTQADLADAAGVGRRFISDLEAGKPTAELGKALAVAKVLGLSLTAATA